MRILCVHQGYELYGSDRCFIESVAALRDAWPDAEIDVVLPCDGPIVPRLRAIATRVIVEPIFVLRRRDLLKLLAIGIFRLVPALWRAMRRMRAADLVYINTVVVLDYLLAARCFPDKTLVHVHEIPDRLPLRLFRRLLAWSRAEVIFNAKATRSAFNVQTARAQHVVYNGIASPGNPHPHHYDRLRALRFLMIGRISRIKGQDVLLEALSLLPPELRPRIEVRIVGNSFANDMRREAALRAGVRAAGLDPVVRFEPFVDEAAPLYRWADVVVPSRLPESLGRVAIEAMAHGRPALVSAQGGLLEVVDDGVTGWAVPADDPVTLARKIGDIVAHPESWSTFPAAARARYEALFDNRCIVPQFQAIVRNLLKEKSGKRQASRLARA